MLYSQIVKIGRRKWALLRDGRTRVLEILLTSRGPAITAAPRRRPTPQERKNAEAFAALESRR